MLEAPALLRVCLSPTRFLALLKHPFVRNRLDVFPEIDEDEMAGVGGRVGEVVRSEPRGEIVVGAGEGALVPGEVGRQLVRVQERGPEDILEEEELVQLRRSAVFKKRGKGLAVGDPILIVIAFAEMACKSLSLCWQTMAPARNPFAPKSLLIP